MDRNRLIIIISTLWGITQFFWLSSDRLIRDGDEEGHVGAAELFRDILQNQGFSQWIFQTWQGDFGEYPPLFASLLSVWWSLFSAPPEETTIRFFGSLFVLGTACFVGRIVWRYNGNWLLGFSMTLFLPLLNGVGRHFMPEILLVFLMLGFSMALVEEEKHPSYKNKFLIGIFGGLGLLAKQSFLLLAPIIALGFLINKKISLRSVWLPLLLILAISSPWYIQQMSEQNQYIQSSIQAKTAINWLAHGAFYPLVIILIGWGVLGSFILLFLFVKNRPTKLPLWSLIWAIGGLALLILLPKKYPRLLLPWLPIIGIWAGLLGRNISARGEIIILVLLFFQFAGLSFSPRTIKLPFQSKLDDGCPQHWLRPPFPHDFQLQRVQTIVQEHPQKSIAVLGDVIIDCTIQSTHNWNSHLDPYLRRTGLNPALEFVTEENSFWKQAQIQIQWKTTTATNNPDDLLIIIQD